MNDAPPIGELRVLAPGIASVLAPNASPMTYWGTNTYLLGDSDLAVIDPGPADDAHLDALIDAIAGRPVGAILVTHAHVDHSPLAAPLARKLGAPICAFGDAQAGRSAVMTQLAQDGLSGGGEGVDAVFAPDEILPDGATLSGRDWQIEALHTPGHFGNHLCFAAQDALFCGDHVMGWASSLVSPPDGDLTDFMASCHKLRARVWSIACPGHGPAIDDVAERLDWLVAHRKGREAQILAALSSPHDLTSLTKAVYTDVAPMMLPAAARNVFAHLVDLHGRGEIRAEPHLGEGARFGLEKS